MSGSFILAIIYLRMETSESALRFKGRDSIMDKMDDEYEFARMSESKFDDFALLARDAHSVELTHDEIRALFDTREWGTDYIGFMAYHQTTGEAAAFYGIFPCLVEYNGKQYLAAQ